MKFGKLEKTDMMVLHEVTRGVRYFRRLDNSLARLQAKGYLSYEERQLWRDFKVEPSRKLDRMIATYGKDNMLEELNRDINNQG